MPLPKRWLTQLINEVAPHVVSWNDEVNLQCHVFQNTDADGDEWEVTLFGEPQTFGGRLKSICIDSCLTVNILNVATLFEDVDTCHWQTGTVDQSDELGPHVAVCGSFRGRRVWLRILSKAPESLRRCATTVPKHLAE